MPLKIERLSDHEYQIPAEKYKSMTSHMATNILSRNRATCDLEETG